MDLIHPSSKADVVDAVREANTTAVRLLVVGGRRHLDKGNPSEIDAELWTTQLDRLVAYEPAEMVAVVEAGMRVAELNRILHEGGQEWAADAPDDATVGGVLASGASSVRRLKVGSLRDTVLEAEVVTGDGRFVKSGARTVKNVTGYDLHKVVCGSLGTLGVIVQVALKVRPLPRATRTLRFEDGGLELAGRLLGAVPGSAAVLATASSVEVRLEGWAEEVEEQTATAREVASPTESLEAGRFPSDLPWDDSPVVAEIAVPPSRLSEVQNGDAWGTLTGVGLGWVGLGDVDALNELRERVRAVGGIAPVVRGSGGLGNEPLPAAAVQQRLRASFDPNGVLAPHRGWGG